MTATIIPFPSNAAQRWAARRHAVLAQMTKDLLAADALADRSVARCCLLVRGHSPREVDLLSETARFAATMAQLREAMDNV
jgi:hypothetical protein